MGNPGLPTNEEIHQVREQINHYYKTGAPSRYTDTSDWIMTKDDIVITRTDRSVTVEVFTPIQGARYDFGERLGEGLTVVYPANSYKVTFELP